MARRDFGKEQTSNRPIHVTFWHYDGKRWELYFDTSKTLDWYVAACWNSIKTYQAWTFMMPKAS